MTGDAGAATRAAALDPARAARARDLSDRLSPIVVKELRQGVRSHLFTGAFLLQQFLLLLVVSLGFLLDAAFAGRDEFAVFFWVVLALPLLLVLPLGAGLSISGEIAAHTLEPVLLTRLTPWRVVAGKWAAGAAQSLVLTIAVLPFVMVRYYLGAVEIARDLTFLAALLACSLLLGALGAAVSAAPLSGLFRWLLVAVVGWPTAVSFLVMVGDTIFSAGLPPPATALLPAAAIALLALLAALEAGALLMAPTALVRPARLRVLALTGLGLAVLLAVQRPSAVRGVAIAWAVVLACGIAVGAVCEATPPVPTRYAWFFRGRVRRALGYLFAPGWPAGVAFALLLALGGAAAAFAWGGWARAAFAFGGIAGALLLPVAVARTLFPRARPFVVLILVTLGTWALSLPAPIAMYLDAPILWRVGCGLLALCPSAFVLARLQLMGDYGLYPATIIPPFADVVFGVVVVLATAVAVWHARREWRRIRGLFAPAAQP